MKIALVSDTHHEHLRDNYNIPSIMLVKWVDWLLNNTSQFDILVLAGDIDSDFEHLANLFKILKTLNKPIVFVDGNHEHYHKIYIDSIKCLSELCSSNNIYYLNNNQITLCGKTIYGGCAWTSFWDSPIYQSYFYNWAEFVDIIQNFKMDDCITVNKDFKNRFIPSDIVITHFSPSIMGSTEKYKTSHLNPYFHDRLENMILNYNPKLWIHGHLHDDNDYILGDTRIICHPMGYPFENNTAIFNYIPKIIEV